MTDTLIDPDQYLDADIYAAREFVRETSGNPDAELLPGHVGTNFCSIAVSLMVHCRTQDFDYESLREDTEHYSSAIGGLSCLWAVTADYALKPAEGNDVVYPDAEDAAQIAEYERDGFVWDEGGGGYMRRALPIPDDAWGPGAGTVPDFIRRYDAGEFPSLHLTT